MPKPPARSAESKRASPPLQFEYRRSFLGDWVRLSESGRFDLKRLKAVMLLLIANDAPLPAEYKIHVLKVEWLGFLECHVGGDFLLIYERRDDKIAFVRAGTHSALFGR